MEHNIVLYDNNGLRIIYQKNILFNKSIFEHYFIFVRYERKTKNLLVVKTDYLSCILEQDIIINDLKSFFDYFDRNIIYINKYLGDNNYEKNINIIKQFKKDLELELNPAQGILNRIRGV